MNLESKLEAILFYKNEPLTIKEISRYLGINEKETRETIGNLSKLLENRGICLIQTADEVSLATAPGMKGLIEQIAKDEMSKEIGRAGLETLSIILYNGPISRREIDHIRGVNSTFILRHLSTRGLVEREPDPKDQRVYRYKASLQLLAHLGLKKLEDLPEFETLKSKLASAQEQPDQENGE